MPFRKETEDVFYFGIQEPVHGIELLCERIDNEAFTGDVLEQVKKRTETAKVVIADLTDANRNVYPEVFLYQYYRKVRNSVERFFGWLKVLDESILDTKD